MSASASPESDIAHGICQLISSTVAVGADLGASMTVDMRSEPSAGAAGVGAENERAFVDVAAVTKAGSVTAAEGRPDDAIEPGCGGLGVSLRRHRSEVASSVATHEDLAKELSEQVLQQSLANQPERLQSKLSEEVIVDSEDASTRLGKSLVKKPSRQSVGSSGAVREFPASISPASDLARDLFAEIVACSADDVVKAEAAKSLRGRARRLLSKALADGSLASALAGLSLQPGRPTGMSSEASKPQVEKNPDLPKASSLVDVPALDIDGALDGAIGNMYKELHEKNKELRASYETLTVENRKLLQERRDMHETLVRVCNDLGTSIADMCSSGAPSLEVPPHEPCLETENRQLEQVNVKLTEANSKLRAENQSLRSEIQHSCVEVQ